MPFDFAALQDILVCPKSKAPLVQDGDWLVSTDAQTRLRYAIRDGIPIMLVDEAQELPREKWDAVMRQHGRDLT